MLTDHKPVPATEKIYELLWKIKQEYTGILCIEDIQIINATLLHRIHEIKVEEKEYAESKD